MRGRRHLQRAVVTLGAAAVVLGGFAAPSSAVVDAPDARDRTTPDAISTTVDLGRYTVNGTVRTSVVDPVTGTTFIGGDFTKIGRRTGSVVAVDPPGVSDGAIRASSPEVLGVVGGVFADDQPGDPGFFIVGFLQAINGQKVAEAPAYRMHLVNNAWVLDTSWAVSGQCLSVYEQFQAQASWIATPTYLIGGGAAGPKSPVDSTTGVMLINRATGRLRNLGGSGCNDADNLLPDIPVLPDLKSCASKSYCQAEVGRLAWDATSHRLLVGYGYTVGSGNIASWSELAAYDLTSGTGGRSWRMALQDQPGPTAVFRGTPNSLAALPGAFLVHGTFPLDGGASNASTLLLIDPVTGHVRQRWSQGGELDPSTGDVIGPSTPCHTGQAVSGPNATQVGSDAVAWLFTGFGAHPIYSACRYGLSGGLLTTSPVGSVSLEVSERYTLPSAPYTAADGTVYLLGSNAALDLTHAQLATWNPDPAMTTAFVNGGPGPTIAVAGGAAILAGDFGFVRGVSVPGLAALDATLTPIATFDPQLVAPDTSEGPYALALSEGRLLVGGRSLTGSGDSLVAVVATTGLQRWTNHHLASVDAIAVEPNGDFWAGGTSSPSSPTDALVHYANHLDAPFSLSAPAIGCLDAASVPEAGSTALCAPGNGLARVSALLLEPDGHLYIGGAFGSVAGVARRGLARLEPDGTVGPWNPDLLSLLSWSSQGGLSELEPRSMAVLGDNLVVGGVFGTFEPYPDGGGHIDEISPLLVFSVTTGGLVRPTDPEHLAWFTTNNSVGYAMVATDAGLAVALGAAGMAVFDATTLELDETASAGYLEQVWFMVDTGNGVYTLAMPGQPGSISQSAVSALSAAAAAPARLVIGGVIPRWKNRVAGNIVRTTVGVDATAPVASSVRAIPQAGRTVVPGSVPVRVSWVGADTHGSGVARYQVAMSAAGGPWVTLSSNVLPRHADVVLRRGRSYRFRVRAIDNAANVGSWAYGPTFTAGITQQTRSAVRYSSGWKLTPGTAYLGGSAKRSGKAGATATFAFTGRGVGLVSTMALLRGKAKIYVDGHYIRTIDLRSATVHNRDIVFSRSWASSARHTLRIVVKGTRGRPRVDVDAFVVIR